jgi:kinesin family protein 2/24
VSRPSSSRSSVISKAIGINPSGQSGISRQSSSDSISSLNESRNLRRKSVGPAAAAAAATKPSSASRRASTATGMSTKATAATAKDRVMVAVRKRPASGMEIDVVECADMSCIQVSEPRKKVDLKEYTEKHQFSFDYAFDESQDNELVYRCTAQPLVPFVIQGGLATCFAFGQTGSGKTFTMLGSPENNIPGLYLLASRDVFRALDEAPEELDVFVSMMEIYGDDVFDLLSSNKQKLIPREDAKKKVQIQGLIERPVRDLRGMMDAIDSGSSQRSTSVTGMNEASSRSHAILQIQLRTMSGKLHGQLSFIDLAGSEKGSDTAENVKKTRMEGAEINKSLLALKECIRAMTDPTAAYTPFRSSKLTQVRVT